MHSLLLVIQAYQQKPAKSAQLLAALLMAQVQDDVGGAARLLLQELGLQQHVFLLSLWELSQQWQVTL